MKKQENIERKTTSIRIDPKLWREFKIFCIVMGLDMNKVLEDMIEFKIKHKEGKNEKANKKIKK